MPVKYLKDKLPSCHLFADSRSSVGPFLDLEYVSDFHGCWPGNEALLRPELIQDLVWNFRDLKRRIEAGPDTFGLSMFTALTDAVGTPELALEFAWELSKEQPKKVLIVDCDMRSQALTTAYGIEPGAGLSDFLTGAQSLRQIVKRTNLRNVYLVKNGLVTVDPVTLFMSKHLLRMIMRLQRRFDHILLNAPAYRVAVDAFVLAKFLRPTLILATATASARDSGTLSIRRELEVLHLPVLNLVYRQ